jgi:hypothetical protein
MCQLTKADQLGVALTDIFYCFQVVIKRLLAVKGIPCLAVAVAVGDADHTWQDYNECGPLPCG